MMIRAVISQVVMSDSKTNNLVSFDKTGFLTREREEMQIPILFICLD